MNKSTFTVSELDIYKIHTPGTYHEASTNTKQV